MKTIATILYKGILALIILIFAGFSAIAQDTIEVKITDALMSKGMQTGYVVEIPQADMKTVEVNWIKKLQENNKTKVRETGQELILGEALKTELSNESLNIYSLLFQRETNITLYVFIEIDSVFFSPRKDKPDLTHKKIDNNIIYYLRSFAADQYRLAVGDELKAQEKLLKSMESDLKKLEKNGDNLKKDNSSLEIDIEEKEMEIIELDANIDITSQELMKHNASMITLTTDIEKDAAKERQKELEKKKKGYEKSRSKAKNNISSYKSKIENNIDAIEVSEEQQAEKEEEIIQQEEVVKQVQAKLDGIK